MDPVILKIIKRCQKDPAFFIDNFCNVKHPKLGVLPFKLFSYQKRCLNDFVNNRLNIFRKCRQCGASTLTGAFALWYAMFFNNKTVLIVSKRDDDAKEYLSRNVKFPYEYLPDWMKKLWKPISINEHTIAFSNGSTIRSLTSSPDTLRSNASSLNIIDEAAFIDKMEDMWAGGWSCVKPETIISCDSGTPSIGSLGNIYGDKWQDIDVKIQSDKGIEKSDKFYVNGVADTKILTSSLGYEIECTENHRLKDEDYDWIYARDIAKGQKLAFKCGSDFADDFDTHLIGDVEYDQNFINAKNSDVVSAICSHCGESDNLNYRTYKRNWNRNGSKFICRKCGPTLKMSPDFDKPKVLDEKLAEVVGYYVGDGSLATGRGSRLRLCYDPQDSDLYDHFAGYFDGLGLNPLQHDANGAKEFRIDNSRFVKWFIKNGFKSKSSARDAVVPPIILKSSPKTRSAFLKGLFEADGWGYRTKDAARPNVGRFHIGFSSVSKKLVKQVQVMLLGFGIISRRFESTGGYENSGVSWRLEVINMDHMIRFMRVIGFISVRKNISIVKQTTMKPMKYSVDDNGIFYDEVANVESSRCMTVDISVPSNNTYIANGFVSHNTLQHGGSVIVISTPKGIGNWYWKTWADAIDKSNDFNPIVINWWDMDWELKFKDELSGVETVIAPTKNLKLLEENREITKYGPGPDGKTFWSPWLEGEYRNLSTKGDDSRFRQEVLAEFIGSGNTVLSRTALNIVDRMNSGEYMTIGSVDYSNASVNEHTVLDFQDLFWIWEKPYTQKDAEAAIREAKKQGLDPRAIPHELSTAHTYIIGADPSSGEADDFCALQVLDMTSQRQVAELRIKALPKTFAKMIDYIGRLYNTAHVVCERNGIGQAVTQELDKDLMYANLYRHSRTTASLKVKYSQIGYPTTTSTKPVLIKQLLDNIGEDGYNIRSTRLYHEMCIFIHLGAGRYGNEPGTGNTDDLVLATCLALAGVQSALMRSGGVLIPLHNIDISPHGSPATISGVNKPLGRGIMAPIGISSEVYTGSSVNTNDELAKFMTQLGGIPMHKNKNAKKKTDSVTSKKHILKYFRG